MGYAPGFLTDDLPVQMAKLDDEALAKRIEEIRQWFAGQVRVLTDHRKAMPIEVRFPKASEIRKQAMAQPSDEIEGEDHEQRELVIVVKGLLLPKSDGAQSDGAQAVRGLQVQLPAQLGPWVLTARRGEIELVAELLGAGQVSRMHQASDQPMSGRPQASAAPMPRPMNCDPFGDDVQSQDGIPPGVLTAGQFLALGFWHIIPDGPDHILFVLGLFLLSAHLKPLLWQVTAFTLAHSVTLALAMNGILELKASFVEPLIAASIAFIAIENLFTTKLQPWRPILVFAFGLLHGLGFASVLSNLHLPAGQFGPAIIGFNIGVEMGQLAVIALAFAAVGWLRKRENYRSLIIIPGSLAIAIIGIYWTIERVLGA